MRVQSDDCEIGYYAITIWAIMIVFAVTQYISSAKANNINLSARCDIGTHFLLATMDLNYYIGFSS